MKEKSVGYKIINKTDEYEYVVHDRNQFRNDVVPEGVLHLMQRLNLRATLAEKLLTHFGVVAGKPQGEDSSGRAALALMEPEEVVDRACTIADLFVNQAEQRGWIYSLPSYAETAAALTSSDEN